MSDFRKEVEEFLHENIRPRLQMDGGDCEMVDLTDAGVVHIKLKGACAGCPGAQMTLQLGIERVLKEKYGDKIDHVVPA